MQTGNVFRKMFLAGAALMVAFILCTGPVFAQEVILPDEIAFGEVEVGQVKTAELVISHTANTQVEAQITFNSACPDFSLGATPNPLIIPAGANGSVIVTYSPTGPGPCIGSMDIRFTWIQPFGSMDLGTKTVTVTGTGKATEEPVPPAVDILSIIDFLDASVAAKTIQGKGVKKAPVRRLNAIRKMLEIADRRVQNEELEKACRLLSVVYNKIDGKHRPQSAVDFLKGEALPQLAAMVAQVMEDLGCP